MIVEIQGLIYDFFLWCEATWIGETIRQSLWLFPVIEAFHLVAFACIGGAVLLVDLRLLGLVFRSQPVAELAASARPWFNGALIVMFVTGISLYASETMKLFYNRPFWIKMIALALAIPFTYFVRRRVVRMDPARVGPVWGKVVGLVDVVLWGTVAWGGRWIGFWG